jgi:colicin import membrane protein
MSQSKRYAPPPERFGIGGMGIAFLAHGCLIAALTWGTSWRSQHTITTASAELWAELPVEAAPPLVVQPLIPAEPIPEQPIAKAPEIVVEKIKPQPKPKIKEKPEPPKRDLKAEAKKKEAEAERVREQVRQDQIKRMAGLAGATGSAASTGTAQQSATPSASYAGKVVGKIRPNIVFADADSVQGNPAAEVDIRIAPDGSILQPIRLSKSSGNKAWDNAVLRAIEKADSLPRDTDGRVPSSMTLILRPKQ